MTKLLRLPAVLDQTGLSRSRLFQLIETGEFPTPLKHSPRVNVWPSGVIEEWIDRFVAASITN